MNLRFIQLFLLIIINLLMPRSSHCQIEFIAHRGASYLAPENTLASINLAWELDSDGAECDIMLSKDKQIVVFHDAKMDRLLGKSGAISEYNYSEFKDLPIKLRNTNLPEYEGQHVPLLRDLLATVPEDKTLVIEIKCGKEIIPHLIEEIEQFWKKGQIAFIAFDYETILETKKNFPRVPCYYLSSDREDLESRFESLINSKLDGVDLNHKIIDKSLVERFANHHKAVWCWTVNLPADASRMKAIGVKSITTDRPAWLREELEKVKY